MRYPKLDCCRKPILTEPENTDKSFVRFLNAIPNTPDMAVDIYVNRKLVVKNLKYEDFTEYVPTRSGVHTIQIYPAGNDTEQLVDMQVTFEPKHIYTATAIGTIDNIEVEVFDDKYMKDSPNCVYMRFINLSPDSLGVNIYIDDIPVVYELEYTEVTDYLKLSAGKHTMVIETEDGTRLVTHPNMVLKEGNIYTSYIVGLTKGEPFIQVLIPLDGSSYIRTDI